MATHGDNKGINQPFDKETMVTTIYDILWYI